MSGSNGSFVAEVDSIAGTDRRRAWAGLWVLASALALIVLDGTIVSVALPKIIVGLRLSLTDAQWVNGLYSVIFAALLLTAGRVGDRFGRRRLLIVGVSVFALGSFAAAMAGGTGTLPAARALQGVGGALVLPSTLSTVNATFRGRDRAAAFGVWGAVMSGAAAIGPLLGGWLTQVGSWRLIFWVNLPLGVAVVAAALRFVDETRESDAAHGTGIDLAGSVLSAVGFGLIVFGLIESSSLGWWSAKAALSLPGVVWSAHAAISPVPVALAVGVVCVGTFLWLERRRLHAGRATLLDLRLFEHQTFALGNFTATLVAVGEFALLFVLPLFLVTALRLDTLQAGMVLASMALGAFCAGAGARQIAAAIGPTRVVVLGLALEMAGGSATALAAAGADRSAWVIAATLLPYGLGLGLAAAQLTSTTLRDIPPAQSGVGSATQSTARQLGSAFGSALGGTTLASALAASHASLTRATPAVFASASGSALWAAVAVLAIALLAAWRLHVVSRRVARLRDDGPGPLRPSWSR